MTVELVQDIVADLGMDEIAREIDRHHALVGEKATEAMEHAIRAGELLLEAKSRVPHGGWTDWIAENIGLSAVQVQVYLRVARFQEIVRREQLQSLKGAVRHFRRAAMPDVRVDPTLRLECSRLRDEGMLHREIAETVGVSKSTVGRWLNPENERKYRENRAKTSRQGRSALKRQRRLLDARKVGGDVAEGYSLLRRALDVFERASGSCSGEARREIRSAMNSLYRAEDAVSAAIRAWDQ